MGANNARPAIRPARSGSCHGNKYGICERFFYMYLYFSDFFFFNVPITRFQMHHLTQFLKPARGSPNEGPSVSANRAAALAALSVCLQAIRRCVSAPLNSSHGKPIKAGVREENPIKWRACSPKSERSPPDSPNSLSAIEAVYRPSI